MATTSLIGIQRDDKNVECVYCNSNGYPEYIGKVLSNNYYNNDKLEELLSYGDISYLSDTIEDCIFYYIDKSDNQFSTTPRILPLDIYTKGSSIYEESFRYMLDLEGNLMCYDVYEDILMDIDSFI